MAKLNTAALMRDLRPQARHSHGQRGGLECAPMRAAQDQGLTFLGVRRARLRTAVPLTWREEHILTLEVLAKRSALSSPPSSRPSGRRVDGRELAAVQDWPPSGVVYLRAEHPQVGATGSPPSKRTRHESL